jgi:hypothetical protein
MNGIFESIDITDECTLHKGTDIVMSSNGEDKVYSIKNIRLVNNKVLLECGEPEIFFNFKDYIEEEKRNAHPYTFTVDDFIKNGRALYKSFYETKVTLGDWSDDGHGKYKEYGIITNYSIKEMQKAYIDSCNKTGLTFHNQCDNRYYGIDIPTDKWRYICTNFEESMIEQEALDILNEYKVGEHIYPDSSKVTNNTDDNAEFVMIIMQFIALSLPDDFRWKFYGVPLADVKSINGWWGKLNVQFGYGLFIA